MLQILSVLVGSLIALAAAELTNRATTRRLKLQFVEDRRNLEREALQSKAEELYITFSAWQNTFFSHYTTMIPVMTGEIGINAAMDLQQKNISTQSEKYNFAKIEMCIRSHFPTLQQPFAKVLSARDEVSEAESDYRLRVKRSAGSRPLPPANYIDLLGDFNKASEVLKNNIADELIRINNS